MLEQVSLPHALRPIIGRDIPPLAQHPCADEILARFNTEDYLARYADIRQTIHTPKDALEHFKKRGYIERRIYSNALVRYFRHGYYRRRYPELRLNTDNDALVHYCYVGVFEDRFPNPATEVHYNARIHLFQMAKVGSKSIEAGIRTVSADYIHHVHWDYLYHREYPHISIPYSRVLAHPRETPALVISGVRDVMSRIVSGYFQDFESRRRDPGLLDISFILQELPIRYENDAKNICGWFDHEYYCGLDVYSYPFDTTLGFTIIEHGPVRVFLYRFEKLRQLEQPLRKFLDMPKFRLERRNISQEKWYAPTYQRVLEEFRVPRGWLRDVLGTRFMCHFYEPEERRQILDRWTG